MQENLKEKYGITDKDLKVAVDQINFAKIACDGIVLVALCDLLCNARATLACYKKYIGSNR